MRELKSERTFEVNKITMNYDDWKTQVPPQFEDEDWEEKLENELDEELHNADDYNDEQKLERNELN